jgi:hypothetical protein
MQCVTCARISPETHGGWPKGWGCLYGNLACCSRECAEEFAKTSSKYGRLRDGDYEPEEGP